MVAKPNRMMAFFAYLLPLVGSLLVFLTERKNLFALYHACQALALLLIAVLAPLVWLLFALAVTWIPIAGPVIGAGSFALVIAAYLAVLVALFFGIANSLQEKLEPVPIFGGWGLRIFEQFARTAP
jgi:uncharacterized membrane protein